MTNTDIMRKIAVWRELPIIDTMTKSAFLTTYRAELLARYPWARDVAKLDRFMASVERTITTLAQPWNKDGTATVAAWRAIGGKGEPTYKALRALPD